MKGSSGVKAFVVVLIIGILTFVTFAGISIEAWEFEIKKITDIESIRYGIDIRGGIRATLTAPKDVNPTEDELEAAKEIINKRLDSKYIYDRSVSIDKVNKRIIIEIPWKKDEKNFDPQKSIDDLGETAMLSFAEVDETRINAENGKYELIKEKIILQGNEVVSAKPEVDPNTGRSHVRLYLSDEGAKKFEEATGRLIGQKIGIFLDEVEFSSPVVNGKISGKDQAIITLNNPDSKAEAVEAKELAATIRSGALPFELNAVEVTSISPLLGQSALGVTAYGGFVALILVLLFLLLYYRLPGIVASIALVGQMVTILLFISLTNMSLTLPGIAGLILTVGMSVDANVIIYERIKEEMRGGKTVQAAIDAGFNRAFTAIFDGNLTTLIVAVVLYLLGTGPIQSFALTLSLGVVLNFIFAIFVTKTILRAIAAPAALKKPWLYGVKGGTSNV